MVFLIVSKLCDMLVALWMDFDLVICDCCSGLVCMNSVLTLAAFRMACLIVYAYDFVHLLCMYKLWTVGVHAWTAVLALLKQGGRCSCSSPLANHRRYFLLCAKYKEKVRF